MKTLTLEHINPFLPYGLKVNTPAGQRTVFGYCNNKLLLRDGECVIGFTKPILYHISWLTKEIMLPGYEKPVVPIVELAKIAFPERHFEANGIFADDKKNIFKFHYYQTSFNGFNHSPNAGSVFIPNQYALFQKLAEWKFNFNGIPDELVVYVTEDFNPYVK